MRSFAVRGGNNTTRAVKKAFLCKQTSLATTISPSHNPTIAHRCFVTTSQPLCACCGMYFCTNTNRWSLQSDVGRTNWTQQMNQRRGKNSLHHQQQSTRGLSSDSPAGVGEDSRDVFHNEHQAGDSPIQQILDNNKVWAAEITRNDPTFFKRLAVKQEPKYLYFGCSDSRVPSNHILGLGPGEVFVHRNIGNQIPGNDLNSLSVLEYAVKHLGVTDIIVTGHYDCGAVRAATSKQDLGMLENWLRLIRDVYRLHKDHLDHISDPEERHRRLVELNVVEQCLNLYKTGVVQRRQIETRPSGEMVPRIHGTVFDQSTGLLRHLKVDFEKRIGNLNHIYSLVSGAGRKQEPA